MGFRRSNKSKASDSKNGSDKPAPAEAKRSSSASSSASPSDLPEELIAARAYEKWKLRGAPEGGGTEQDWYAARAELESERLNWAAPQAGDEQRSTGK